MIHCCYGVVERGGRGSGCGRPLVVDGRAITSPTVPREGWCERGAASLDDAREPLDLPADVRQALSAAWARDAALEHASIASFARFALDLLAAGAPADLVRDAHAAMRDEIDHAARCYALASRFAGRALGPGPLPIAGVTAGGSVDEAAARALVEGCVGESIAAVLARHARDAAVDPEARATLDVIARDEAEHAVLAFRFVAWALRGGDARAALRDAAQLAIDEALGAIEAGDARLDATFAAFGQPTSAVRARATREAVEEVISPCLAALFDRPRAGPAVVAREAR